MCRERYQKYFAKNIYFKKKKLSAPERHIFFLKFSCMLCLVTPTTQTANNKKKISNIFYI